MSRSFIVFFCVVLAVYFGGAWYVFVREWQSLEAFPVLQMCLAVIFWVSALSYIIARLVENRVQNTFSDLLVWYGSMWLGFFVYSVMFIAAIDLARSLATMFGYPPVLWMSSYSMLKFWVFLGVFTLVSITLTLGLRNALMPRVRKLTYTIHKYGGDKTEWNIVLVTDIHLGTIVNRERAQQLVGSIRELEPDIVLFGGDTVDEDVRPVIRGDIGNVLKQIDAPYGTYAIPGNHEYIGGIDPALNYLRAHEITVLRDEAVLVGNSFYLVGRDDISRERFFAGEPRKSLDALLSQVDMSRPIVMLDHQPFDLQKVADDGRVDIQFSGHTHNGQMWPFNYVTGLIFEKSWGERKIKNTIFYVSSGWGTWGPPIRLGNTPEIVHVKVRFTAAK